MVEVELQNVIAASPLNTGENQQNQLYNTGATGDAMSRDYDDWDD